MIAMRADAMSGGYWDCHDISSVFIYGNLYGGKEELLVAPLCMAKEGDHPIQ
jgi:hypothetical protein